MQPFLLVFNERAQILGSEAEGLPFFCAHINEAKPPHVDVFH